MSEKKRINVETTTLKTVPQEERKSWVAVTFIQAGVYICVPSLLLGGLLIASMALKDAIIAGVLGYILSAVLMAFVGMIGSDLGRPTVVVAQSAFGKQGTRFLISTVFTVASLGWFAVQNVVCGNAFSFFLKEAFGINFPVAASIILWGIIMLITAVKGIDGLKILNNISVPALFITFCIGAYLALTQGGGAPLDSGSDAGYTMSIFDGVVMTASFLSVGMTIAPDFTRYQKSRSGVLASSLIGMIPAGVALLVIGALLTKITGQYDLSAVLTSVGIPALGIIVLILATWTTNTTNAYSAGISIVNIFNLKEQHRAVATLVAGVLGTVVAALGWANSLEAFINMLAMFFFPVAAAMLADYWILRKGKVENWGYIQGFNFRGLIAWIAGVAVTYYVTYGLIIGFIATAVIYLILSKISPTKNELTE